MDPVVTRRNNRRKGCRRNFLRGGSAAPIPEGGAYSVGGPLVPGLSNASVINPISACQSAMRPMPSFSSSAGIPGMRGGRYETSLEVTPNGIPLSHAIPIPCERGGSPTEPTSPLYYASKGGFNNSLTIPTAAYTRMPSDFVTASGTPLMLNVPVNGRTCGGRRKASRKASRKHRKASRKASRKHRKSSRKASRKH
jgi:hypothetical protein